MQASLPNALAAVLLAGCTSDGASQRTPSIEAGAGGSAGMVAEAAAGGLAPSFDATAREAGRVSDATMDSTRPQPPPTFRKIVLTNAFYAEGATYADFDRDGITDVVSGPYWYEGPAFTTKHALYTPVEFDPKSYSDNFLEFARDFDGDGFPDVLVVNFPGQDASVYANPKAPDAPWVRHQVVSAVDIESPAFADLTGDGQPELVFASGNQIGWAGPDTKAPHDPWIFHAATSVGSYAAFTHGLGVGDVDGDGRADLLEAGGCWKQPANLTNDPVWTLNAQDFGSGGAQMFAYDVDGDGDEDVVTSLAAHEYGIAWFEQQRGSGTTTFARHLIATDDPADAGTSALVFQPHALAVADVDGNGLLDIVTGERFWGHVPAGTPDPNGPAKLYWFELERTSAGARFTPHLVDDASGVGTQVVTGDLDGDGLMDIVTANKKGAFVFLQQRM